MWGIVGSEGIGVGEKHSFPAGHLIGCFPEQCRRHRAVQERGPQLLHRVTGRPSQRGKCLFQGEALDNGDRDLADASRHDGIDGGVQLHPGLQFERARFELRRQLALLDPGRKVVAGRHHSLFLQQVTDVLGTATGVDTNRHHDPGSYLGARIVERLPQVGPQHPGGNQ